MLTIIVVVTVAFWTDFIVDLLVTYAVLLDPMYFYLSCTLEATLSSGNGSFGKVQSSATMETGWELYSLPRLNLNKFLCVFVPVLLHIHCVYRRDSHPSNYSDTTVTTSSYPPPDNCIKLTSVGRERPHNVKCRLPWRDPDFIRMDFLLLRSLRVATAFFLLQ